MQIKRSIEILLVVFYFLFVFYCPAAADDGGTIDHQRKGVSSYAWVRNILQVTTTIADEWFPCWGAEPWSSDGQWLVYNFGTKSPHSGGISQLCKMRADGTDWTQLTNTAYCCSHASFIPPDNTRILFQRESTDVTDRGADICIMDTDGTNVELITHGDEFPPCCLFDPEDDPGYNKPMISPNGLYIAYRSQSFLHVMQTDADGSGKRYPTRISVSGVHACTRHTWDPDSQYILYDATAIDCSGRKIHKVKYDGTGHSCLSDDNLEIWGYNASGDYVLIDIASNDSSWSAKGENWAFFSPNGQYIAYHTRYGKDDGNDYSEKDEYSALSLMNADGTNKRNLVVKGGGPDGDGLDPDWVWVCGPKSWSPDSQWIAFKMRPTGAARGDKSADPSHTSSIFMININTLQIVRLTKTYHDASMRWSPNGSTILFNDPGELSRDSGNPGDWDLMVMNMWSEAMPIPTLNEWGMILFSLSLAGAALFITRKHRANA